MLKITIRLSFNAFIICLLIYKIGYNDIILFVLSITVRLSDYCEPLNRFSSLAFVCSPKNPKISCNKYLKIEPFVFFFISSPILNY